MKTRKGFVSNSSTTSFVILVKPDKVDDVSFILRHIDRNNHVRPVSERKVELREEMRELDLDAVHLNKIRNRLEKIVDQSYKDYKLLAKYDNGMAFRADVIRSDRNYPIEVTRLTRSNIIKRINQTISDINNARHKAKTELEKLVDQPDWQLITFEDDAMFGRLKEMVDELVSKGDAILIHKETS